MNPHCNDRAITRARGRIAKRSAAALIVSGVLLSAAAVDAAPLERGTFHDAGSEFLEDFCDEDILDMTHEWVVDGQFLGVGTGRAGLIHFRDSLRGTDIWTNENTGRVYYGTWTANSRDLFVTDNGDGTLTIEVKASGGTSWYTDTGLKLRDPGQTRFAFIVDHNGTPTNPFDDEFVEDLGVTFGSTGRNDLQGRDFCEDLLLFTTP